MICCDIFCEPVTSPVIGLSEFLKDALASSSVEASNVKICPCGYREINKASNSSPNLGGLIEVLSDDVTLKAALNA